MIVLKVIGIILAVFLGIVFLLILLLGRSRLDASVSIGKRYMEHSDRSVSDSCPGLSDEEKTEKRKTAFPKNGKAEKSGWQSEEAGRRSPGRCGWIAPDTG